jgi:four helix bundle protein
MEHRELGMGNWTWGIGHSMYSLSQKGYSVCANIAEGRCRQSDQDNRRFVKIARSSLYETVNWLRLAYARQLITSEQVSKFKPIIDKLLSKLNAYLNSIGRRE